MALARLVTSPRRLPLGAKIALAGVSAYLHARLMSRRLITLEENNAAVPAASAPHRPLRGCRYAMRVRPPPLIFERQRLSQRLKRRISH